MSDKVLCYNKTIPIFTCKMDDDGIITRLYDVLDEKHLPILLQNGNFTLEAAKTWLDSRKIPENRDGLQEARVEFKNFENYHNMFSLSDQYWFQHSQKETWKKLNFFTNSYQNDTGKIFFEPWSVDPRKIKMPNPDITTNGVLKKRWIQQENGVSYLIKAGSRRFNQNPIAEVLTSMFLEKLNIIPFVKYSLVADGLKMCSICQNFIDADTEFVPCSHIYYKKARNKNRETIYDHIVSQSVAYGLNEEYVKNYLDTMLAADYIIQNTDRHLNNFGYIRDVNSGRILGFAPLFDSGSAFSASTNEKAQKMFQDRLKTAINKTFNKLEIEEFTAEPMLQMVSAFPTLTREEKNIIRSKVKESTDRIMRGGKKKKPREIIEDR